MRTLITIISAIVALLAFSQGAIMADTDVTTVELNGLVIDFDNTSGAMTRLYYDGPGDMLTRKGTDAGLLDVAVPIEGFDPLRATAGYSKDALVTVEKDRVTIEWQSLGLTRDFGAQAEGVAAKVVIRECEDGESVTIHCEIENNSSVDVRQVLFPDFRGLQPVDGRDWTYLRTCGSVARPFAELGPKVDATFYPHATHDVAVYSGGSAFTNMIGRWLDFGGHSGGLSIFSKEWVGSPLTNVRVENYETRNGLRLSFLHDTTVAQGEKWQSPEYVLTPHKYGWAKGIAPYRKWLEHKIERVTPVPQHVKRGQGFRTVWMCKGYPADGARDADFTYSDLPEIAKESKEYGLDEMVVWFWQPPFQIPNEPPYPHLGTEEELASVIDECKKIGVNVSLFVSIMSLAEPSASKYGATVYPGGWNYHPEMIPRMNPPYATARATGAGDPTNPDYRKDVRKTLKHIIDNFSPSICWDQVIGDPASGELYDIFDDLRKWQYERDPEATFSGESVVNMEKDAAYLDYTWIWLSLRDFKAYNNAFKTPRLNVNINRIPEHVKYAFVDGSYINVMPSKPDGPNATAMIGDYRDVSAAIMQCKRLHDQFEEYFADGENIGDCMLVKPVYGAYVGGFALEDRLIMVVFNVIDETDYAFEVDVAPWIETKDFLKIVHYEGNGEISGIEETETAKITVDAGRFGKNHIKIIEFVAQDKESNER